MLSPVTLQQITDSKLERDPARNLLRLVLLGSCYLEAGAGVRFLPAVTDRECPGAKGRRARRKYGIAYALSGQAIFVCDTPVKMLVPGNGKKKSARLLACGRDERPWGSDALVLSRLCSGFCTHLSGLSFECHGAFAICSGPINPLEAIRPA